jgi:hypothetical protein
MVFKRLSLLMRSWRLRASKARFKDSGEARRIFAEAELQGEQSVWVARAQLKNALALTALARTANRENYL